MISFQNISKIYCSANNKTLPALVDISFDIKPAEMLCLVGKSGAGKTTLVKLLIGEEKPTKGDIFFKNMHVNRLSSRALQKLRQRIGVIHQDYRLLSSKNVQENLSYIMEVIGANLASIKRDVPQVLSLVGLSQRAGNFPAELSGGEKQRLAIARALIHRPEVIIADEPTGNLDAENTQEVVNLLKRINQMGTTVILSTHDQGIIDSLKTRVVALDHGRLISDR